MAPCRDRPPASDELGRLAVTIAEPRLAADDATAAVAASVLGVLPPPAAADEADEADEADDAWRPGRRPAR